jgi:hypothetical protein
MLKKVQENKLEKGDAIAQHRGPVYVSSWHHKKREMVSVYRAAQIRW